jgi:hypothetical protein
MELYDTPRFSPNCLLPWVNRMVSLRYWRICKERFFASLRMTSRGGKVYAVLDTPQTDRFVEHSVACQCLCQYARSLSAFLIEEIKEVVASFRERFLTVLCNR